MLPGMDSGLAVFQTTSSGSGSSSSGGLTATISPSTISKTGSTRGASKILVTGTVTVTASGGAGGYFYSWVRTSGSLEITAGSPTAASTTFSALCDPDDSFTATFACTVTDAAGATTVVSVTVTITLVLTDPGGESTL